MEGDASCGYEAHADAFITARSNAGVSVVEQWAGKLAEGASVVDVGCGHGEPLTRILIDRGLDVYALDASPKLVDAFQKRFSGVPVACEPAQSSDFFGRQFDAALCVGLIFLLSEDDQKQLILSLSQALKPGGSLMLSAPTEQGRWEDMLTKQSSISLGAGAYEHLFGEAGLRCIGSHLDRGGTHYYEAERA